MGNDNVFKELNVLCEPIMRYLSTHHNIHTEVCISEYGIQVKQVIIGIPKEWCQLAREMDWEAGVMAEGR